MWTHFDFVLKSTFRLPPIPYQSSIGERQRPRPKGPGEYRCFLWSSLCGPFSQVSQVDIHLRETPSFNMYTHGITGAGGRLRGPPSHCTPLTNYSTVISLELRGGT
jgi:hypothetical protein